MLIESTGTVVGKKGGEEGRFREPVESCLKYVTDPWEHSDQPIDLTSVCAHLTQSANFHEMSNMMHVAPHETYSPAEDISVSLKFF
jgi:hypothetical protein